MDWVSDKDTGLLGIESLAIDPSSPNKLYLSAGIAYLNGGASAILKSDDYGQTFQRIDVTSQFKVHGNGMGAAMAKSCKSIRTTARSCTSAPAPTACSRAPMKA
jgi:hypothetical protein